MLTLLSKCSSDQRMREFTAVDMWMVNNNVTKSTIILSSVYIMFSGQNIINIQSVTHFIISTREKQVQCNVFIELQNVRCGFVLSFDCRRKPL